MLIPACSNCKSMSVVPFLALLHTNRAHFARSNIHAYHIKMKCRLFGGNWKLHTYTNQHYRAVIDTQQFQTREIDDHFHKTTVQMGKKSKRVRTKQETEAGGRKKEEQYALHKKEFDRIIAKYKLDAPDKTEDIAELLTNQDSGVSAPAFAEKFGMKVEEAVVFLEWIKGEYQSLRCLFARKKYPPDSLFLSFPVGIKFKEEAIDTAKKAGLSKS